VQGNQLLHQKVPRCHHRGEKVGVEEILHQLPQTYFAQRSQEINFSIMEIQIIKNSINRKQLEEIAKPGFGELIKAVVDVNLLIILGT